MPERNQENSDAQIALVASWAIVVVIVVQGTLSMLTQTDTELTVIYRIAAILCILAAAVLFTLVQLRTLRDRALLPWVPWLGVALATIAFVIGAWLGGSLALGMIALLLTGHRLAIIGSAYIAGLVGFMLTQQINPLIVLFYILVVAAIGLILYVFTRLAVTVGELARARETVAILRVDEERHRISRDLHDILGRTLVAVSLRIQTAILLLHRDRDKCGEQLEEVAKMVSEGQSQLRGLTLGETVLGFRDELASAQKLFSRLGVRCVTDLSPTGPIGETVDSLGSRVLRECITNLLKHSRPTWTEVSLREESTASVLVIVNDGAPDAARSRGTGLADLAERAAALGGSLEAGHVSGGRFRVIARIPNTPASPLTPDTSAPTTLGVRP